MPSGESANVEIHNASSTGLLIQTGLELAEGDGLIVELPEVGEREARVVWASGRLFGCEFREPVSQAVLSAAELRSAVENDVTLRSGGLAIPGESFGERIRRLRGEAGLTLDAVAERIGVSKPTVWAWEHEKARPTQGHLDALAKLLGATANDLESDWSDPRLTGILAESRESIARSIGIRPDQVKILIEL
nr:helix-turn-helix transcriptional regulator [Erythrobacter sp. HKB08]